MARPPSDLPEIRSSDPADVDLDDLAAIVASTAPRLVDRAEPDDQLTREFWGAAPGWRTTGSTRVVGRGDSGRTRRVGRTGTIERTRTHRTVSAEHVAVDTPTPPPPPRRSAPPPVEVELDEHVPTGTLERLAARLGLGAVDPLVLRIGLVVLLVALLVPLALALRSDESPADVVRESSVGAVVAPRPAADPAVETPAGEAPGAAPVAPSVVASSPSAAVPATTVPSTVALLAPAEVDEEAERVEPVCGATYEAAEGDYWIRLADEAGITLRELLGANGATTSTPLYPGTEVCLPPGAAMPSPPPPPTTAPPATTTPPAPTTTVRVAAPAAAPTTTAAPRPAAVSTDQVQVLIREIWPDELEEKALQIAFRESRYQATAYNGWCCYGVFQIHWKAHQGWLAGVGVTSSQQLLDARTNIQLAYTIYQRAGGWGPWGG